MDWKSVLVDAMNMHELSVLGSVACLPGLWSRARLVLVCRKVHEGA
jgi:hypothetical protein